MCRHLAYLGPPRALATFIDAPHGLCQQGRAPREMVVAKDNPDGWGIAWWKPDERTPHRYRTTTTMWDDHDFPDCDHRAVAVLGAVRKASPGTTLRAANNAPFVADTRVGPVAFSLNGYAFHGGSEARLRGELANGTVLDGDTDSEVLFALLRERINAGIEPATALAAVHHIANPSADAYVNLLLVTRDQIAATTWQHTLYLRHTGGATTIASEALDTDPGWSRIPDAHLVAASHHEITATPLEGLR